MKRQRDIRQLATEHGLEGPEVRPTETGQVRISGAVGEREVEVLADGAPRRIRERYCLRADIRRAVKQGRTAE